MTANAIVADTVHRPGFDVRYAQTPAELSQIVQIRARVFRDEQHIVDDDLSDPDDWNAVHAYVALDGRIIAAGRLALPTALRTEGQIAWVATLPEYRRRGAADAVMQALLSVADDRRVARVVISAQTHAFDLYRRLGFVPYGSRFHVRGIEHQRMERRLPCPIPGA